VKEALERIRDEIWGDTSLPLSLAKGIDDLPLLAQGEGEQIAAMPDGGDTARNPYVDFVKGQGKVLYNHQARPHNDDDMKIVRALREGSH